MSQKLTTAQIGKCGELLVQYRLLLLGVESSPMSTDTGIDLVAYSPTRHTAHTIQVKANERPKPGGGKGKAALDWWLREDSPAELVALVDLSSEAVWMFRHEELVEHAQQISSGRLHFYLYTDETARGRIKGRRVHLKEFEGFAMGVRAPEIFGV